MEITFPYQYNAEGRTADQNGHKHIRDLIEQILFTNPGERVNRPNFGSGLLQSVFEPNSEEIAATLQFLIQGSLNQFLGTLIEVNQVQLNQFESSLEVLVSYTILSNRETNTVSILRAI